MARFRATTRSEADIDATRDDIWAVLTDPAKIARLTPLVRKIDVHDDTWVWHMSEVKALGVGITPIFTETMTFTDRQRIEYTHAKPDERVGVDGWYEITDAAHGIHLAIELTVSVELPLPHLSSPGVTTVMKKTMQSMGDRFAVNLCSQLGYC